VPQNETIEVDWDTLMESAPYARQAFAFVQDGLGYTVRQVHGDPKSVPPGERHISGQQLCIGLRDYAIKRYGLLAQSVLEHWNVHRTDDFGRIVFALIDAGMMSSEDQDSLEDFYSVYRFEDAFSQDRVLEMLGVN